jgi:ankyrin repeat protein
VSRTALFNAAKAWDAEKVTALLKAEPELIRSRDARGRSALHICALSRWDGKSPSAHASIATARALIAAGEDVNVVHEIPDDGEMFPATPLWYALAWGRNLPLTKALLESGARPDWCLWTVVWSDEVIPLRLLLAAGSRTDLTFDGETPLLYAARLGREGPLRELVRAGARIDVKDRKGRSPLDHARRKRLSPSTLELLGGSPEPQKRPAVKRATRRG